jgi:phage terminase small subunit
MTDKQDIFCQEYMIDLNATQAAIRAGYSPDTARDIGCENLAKPNIQDRIAELMAGRNQRTNVPQDKVIRELSFVAFSRYDEFVEWEYWTPPPKADGTQPQDRVTFRFKPSTELTERQRAAIEQFKMTGNGPELKLKDASKALNTLAVHVGMGTERVNVNNEFVGMTEDVLLRKVSLMLVSMPTETALGVVAEVVRRAGLEAVTELFTKKEEDEDGEDEKHE